MLLILSSCLAHIICAQTEQPDIAEEISDLINYHIIDINDQSTVNIAQLNQIGDNNAITVLQQYSGNVTNQISSVQLGDNNRAYINETGDGHTALLLQNGCNNEANLWSEGSLTFTKVQQIGNDNVVDSYIINNKRSLSKAAILQQTGDNNRIDLALLGDGRWYKAWPITAYFKQTGNDLNVNAISDSYQYPVYIEQQAGTRGGMSVSVSTSAFSFPMKNYK